MEQGRLNWIANFWWVMPALSSEAFMSSRAALVGLSTASRRRCTVIGSILAKGILEAIDMDSYRVEKQAALKIQLPDADAQIEPVPTAGGGRKPEAELDRLSNILKTFNDQFGNVSWADADRVHKLITEDIPNRVAADPAYRMRSRTRTSRTRASNTTRHWPA